MSATAQFISERISDSGAIQRVYSLSEPLKGHSRVVVSAVVALFSGPEVLIFPADEDGRVREWGELDGQRGHLDHGQALRAAGYEVTK